MNNAFQQTNELYSSENFIERVSPELCYDATLRLLLGLSLRQSKSSLYLQYSFHKTTLLIVHFLWLALICYCWSYYVLFSVSARVRCFQCSEKIENGKYSDLSCDVSLCWLRLVPSSTPFHHQHKHQWRWKNPKRGRKNRWENS